MGMVDEIIVELPARHCRLFSPSFLENRNPQLELLLKVEVVPLNHFMLPTVAEKSGSQ